MNKNFIETHAYEKIKNFIDTISKSLKIEKQHINSKYMKELDTIKKIIINTPLSDEKGRFANPNLKIVFLQIKHDNKYFINSWGNFKRLDYGTGHELNYLCYCYQKNFEKDLEINEVCNLLIEYFKIIKMFINKFNIEPAGSKGMWTLDSYQLLPYVIGSAQASSQIDEWFQEILDRNNSILYGRLFHRKWNDIYKDMFKMYDKEVLSRHVVTKSFIFSDCLKE